MRRPPELSVEGHESVSASPQSRVVGPFGTWLRPTRSCLGLLNFWAEGHEGVSASPQSRVVGPFGTWLRPTRSCLGLLNFRWKVTRACRPPRNRESSAPSGLGFARLAHAAEALR